MMAKLTRFPTHDLFDLLQGIFKTDNGEFYVGHWHDGDLFGKGSYFGPEGTYEG